MRIRYFFLFFALLLAMVSAHSQVAVPAPGIVTVPAWGVEGARPSMPVLTTPIVSLTPVSPSPVGATNATAGLIAGATDSTLNNVPGPTSAVTMQPQFLTSVGALEPAYQFEPAGPATSRPSQTGPSVFSSAYTAVPQRSNLGEVARVQRQQRAGHTPRTYTNDDINRIQQTPNTLPTGAMPQSTPEPPKPRP